jgi:hypothetical protein
MHAGLSAGCHTNDELPMIRSRRHRSIKLLEVYFNIIRLDVGRLWQRCSRMQRAGIRLQQLVTGNGHTVCVDVPPKPPTV